MAALAVVPAVVYGWGLLVESRAAGASCFLGQCARGDRYAEAAALAFALVLVALLAARQPRGWLRSAWSAGVSAVVLGAASLLWPTETGAVSGGWAVATLAWGGAFGAVAQMEHRARGEYGRRDDAER